MELDSGYVVIHYWPPPSGVRTIRPSPFQMRLETETRTIRLDQSQCGGIRLVAAESWVTRIKYARMIHYMMNPVPILLSN